MALLRALLVGVTLIALLALPLSLGGAPMIGKPSAAAASTTGPFGTVLQQGDDNDNDDNDNEDAVASDDNDNEDAVASDDNDNDDEAVAEVPAPTAQAAAAAEPPDVVGVCIGSGSQGGVSLIEDAGSVFLTVMGNQPQDTQVTLTDVSPDSLPGVPGIVVSDFTFTVSGNTCGGAGAGAPGFAQFPSAVNLGISYDPNLFPSLDEDTFVIMRLVGDQWVPVESSIADPANDYISATIMETGTYAVVAR